LEKRTLPANRREKTQITENMKNAAEYADIIMRDEREKIVTETPTKYGDDEIERIYEFADGAVVRYEWQSLRFGGASAAEQFNHRFTLVELPTPNPDKFKTGIIRQINYPC
jgi:hypothetical protein